MVDKDQETSVETTVKGDAPPKSEDPKQETTTDPDSDPPRDDEGLLLEYDVVICGTGLVQSILASALTRAGKSVLHCDGSDSYGELDAVWSQSIIQDLWDQQQQQIQQELNQREMSACHVLEEEAWPTPKNNNNQSTIHLSPTGGMTSLRFHSKNVNQYFGIEIGTEVLTPYGKGIVLSINEDSKNKNGSSTSMQIELYEWKLANGKSPVVYVTIPSDVIDPSDTTILEEYLRSKEKIRSVNSIQTQELLTQHRFFALDATPSFVLASGPAVQGMLASGVADYLEFKAIEGLYWLQKQEQTKQQSNDESYFELFRVPCSKNDVFGTKLLPPMDKRRLMKFIQLSMDYATKLTVAEELVQVNNPDMDDDTNLFAGGESEVQSLNERHLNQGRSLARPQNKVVATNELQVLQQCIDQDGMTFDDFLSQHYKLSPKLRSIVRYALAWETEGRSTSLADGMSTLRHHLQALGRYGTTAFLFPLYGSGELSQAFCRSAAVFGATYLLRRAPLAIQCTIGKEEEDNIKMVDGIRLSGDRGGEEDRTTYIPRESKEKIVKCSHVVAPSVALINNEFTGDDISQQRVARRLSILSGMVIPSESGEQRHVIFIPPNSLGNIHAIHGVLLDSSVCVAPKGCTLLHLTTTVTVQNGSDAGAESENVAEILEQAERAVLSSRSQDGNDSGNKRDTTALYHVSFSYCCAQFSHQFPSNSKSPNGLHICSHTGQSLTVDAAFQQAEQIFSSICPGMKFLQLAYSFDEVIRERAGEKRYDDDEKMMLESALGMIEESSDHTEAIVAEIAHLDLPPI